MLSKARSVLLRGVHVADGAIFGLHIPPEDYLVVGQELIKHQKLRPRASKGSIAYNLELGAAQNGDHNNVKVGWSAGRRNASKKKKKRAFENNIKNLLSHDSGQICNRWSRASIQSVTSTTLSEALVQLTSSSRLLLPV